jgi:hypothetical protein
MTSGGVRWQNARAVPAKNLIDREERLIHRGVKLESGVNFSVSLQIWPKTGICTQNVCSSRSIFRNAACAASALQRS